MISQTSYMVQRLTALFMIPFVLVHIGVMIIAIQDGLTAQEILSRTQGSLFWALFYGSFVLAVSLHASIGVVTILYETFNLPVASLKWLMVLLSFVFITMGLAAVAGVVWPG